MSGVVWVAALSPSSTMHRKATDRKNVITPEARPMPTLRKNLFINGSRGPLKQLYVRIIT
jgi:hypothetical protein